MKNFFVIANKSKEEAIEIQGEIKKYIENHDGKCDIDNSLDGHTDISGIPVETECIIVLGGDGTLLRVSHELGSLELPILGINIGNLGYLTAVERADAFDAIDRMLNDDYMTESRMMISSEVKKISKSGESFSGNTALNEIVIKGNKPMQLLLVSVFINDQFLKTYQADGIIVATPTGSTGYSLSAGGPILNPSSDMIIITPICPHSMNGRSLVFSSEDSIKIVIEDGRTTPVQSAEIYFDGTDMISLETKDEIVIYKSKQVTKTVKLSQESFLDTLQKKLRDN